MADTSSHAMDCQDSDYPGQYADQGITISVPVFARGMRASSWSKLNGKDDDFGWDKEEEGGREKGWGVIGNKVAEEEGNVTRWQEGMKIRVEGEEGKNNHINAWGAGKKMGFAQAVRETMLKEKGVSTIS